VQSEQPASTAYLVRLQRGTGDVDERFAPFALFEYNFMLPDFGDVVQVVEMAMPLSSVLLQLKVFRDVNVGVRYMTSLGLVSQPFELAMDALIAGLVPMQDMLVGYLAKEDDHDPKGRIVMYMYFKDGLQQATPVIERSYKLVILSPLDPTMQFGAGSAGTMH
jgi:hypothetical protein